ncbi:MAG: hypothetical protein CR217_01390 [Beijerinckiaceae bacterium]|nr:MAG: hypothetical protein CR217_01390 [Beijerinckiaceae bacterium]
MEIPPGIIMIVMVICPAPALAIICIQRKSKRPAFAMQRQFTWSALRLKEPLPIPARLGNWLRFPKRLDARAYVESPSE